MISFFAKRNLERQLAEEELDVDIMSTIIDALGYHIDSHKVVESACIAFSSLISLNGKI